MQLLHRLIFTVAQALDDISVSRTGEIDIYTALL